VLDNWDDDFKTPPFEDAAIVFAADGKSLQRVSRFNFSQTVGGCRSISVSGDGSFFVVCENTADRLSACLTVTGDRLWSANGDFCSATVARDGKVFALCGDTIYGEQIEVRDREGRLLQQAKIGGFDIVLDEDRQVVWLVGGKIVKCSLDLAPLVELDPIPWCGVSIDVNGDGSVWVAEREHFQVAGSTNRLLKVSTEGGILKAINLDWSPMCLRVDRFDDALWVTGFDARKPVVARMIEAVEKRIGPLPLWKARNFLTRERVRGVTCKYNREGALIDRIAQGGHSLDLHRADGSIWIDAMKSLLHHSRDGRRLGEISGVSTDQKYIAILPGAPTSTRAINPWNLVFLAGFIAYLSIRGVFAQRTKQNEKVVRRAGILEKALLGFVIPTGVFLPLLCLFTPLLNFADYNLPAWAPWCGVGLMVAALWLFWRSHADLGLNWSVTLELRKEHQLIQHGVYRAVRHPMYASILLWGLAQGLLLQNWLAGWSAFVPFALMYLLRTSREEAMMAEFFGQEYRDYMARTGRLLPRWRAARGD
jgi:protein-S-isoprenylcysteine O-methyltransferase Ste14